MIGSSGGLSRRARPARLRSLVPTVCDVAARPKRWAPLVHHDALERLAVPLLLGETSEVWLQG
jgi:hypothetical protein